LCHHIIALARPAPHPLDGNRKKIVTAVRKCVPTGIYLQNIPEYKLIRNQDNK